MSATVLSRHQVITRARRLGIVAMLTTLTALTLAEIAVATWPRSGSPKPGSLDLSRSWEWPYLILASLGPATATYLVTLRRHDRAEAQR
jgi:hypothetical protein